MAISAGLDTVAAIFSPCSLFSDTVFLSCWAFVFRSQKVTLLKLHFLYRAPSSSPFQRTAIRDLFKGILLNQCTLPSYKCRILFANYIPPLHRPLVDFSVRNSSSFQIRNSNGDFNLWWISLRDYAFSSVDRRSDFGCFIKRAAIPWEEVLRGSIETRRLFGIPKWKLSGQRRC